MKTNKNLKAKINTNNCLFFINSLILILIQLISQELEADLVFQIFFKTIE